MSQSHIHSHPLAVAIIEATAKLIAEVGIGGATVRNIAKHADVLPPQIYKHIGNIDQLMNAAAFHLWRNHPHKETCTRDSIDRLYMAIERFIDFGLSYPDLYLHVSKPREVKGSSFWSAQVDELRGCIREVAKAGLLHVSEKQALELIQPFSVGMIFTCLHHTSRTSDICWLARQAVKPLLKKGTQRSSSNEDAPDPIRKAPTLAAELKANLGVVKTLTLGERALMREWLDRIAST